MSSKRPDLPATEKLKAIRQFTAGRKVSEICKDLHLSRTVFYKWLKRLKNTPANERGQALESKRPKGTTHYRYIPGLQEEILTLVQRHPELSSLQLKDAIEKQHGQRLRGTTAIYNFLKRHQLSTYRQRRAFATSRELNVSPNNGLEDETQKHE